MMDKTPFKNTMDKLLGDIRAVTHSMIDQNYFSESPIKLVREALDYLDKQNVEINKEESLSKLAPKKSDKHDEEHECCGGGCHEE